MADKLGRDTQRYHMTHHLFDRQLGCAWCIVERESARASAKRLDEAPDSFDVRETPKNSPKELFHDVWTLRVNRPTATLYHIWEGLLHEKAEFYDADLAQKVVDILNG